MYVLRISGLDYIDDFLPQYIEKNFSTIEEANEYVTDYVVTILFSNIFYGLDGVQSLKECIEKTKGSYLSSTAKKIVHIFNEFYESIYLEKDVEKMNYLCIELINNLKKVRAISNNAKTEIVISEYNDLYCPYKKLNNFFDDENNIALLSVVQLKTLQSIKKIYCKNKLEDAIKILLDYTHIYFLPYEENFKNIQTSMSQHLNYLEELLILDLDEFNDFIKKYEPTEYEYIIKQYFNNKLLILGSNGLINYNNYYLDSIFSTQKKWKWLGNSINNIPYKHPMEIYITVNDFASNTSNELCFIEKHLSEFKLIKFFQSGIYHSQYYYLYGKKYTSSKNYPFYIDIIPDEGNGRVCFALCLNEKYLINNNLNVISKYNHYIAKQFKENYLQDVDNYETFVSSSSSSYFEDNINIILESFLTSELNETMILEKVNVLCKYLKTLSNISKEEINSFYLKCFEEAKQQKASWKIKYQIIDVDFGPKNYMSEIDQNILNDSWILKYVWELETALLASIDEYYGKVIRQDYQIILNHGGHHYPKVNSITMAPYICLFNQDEFAWLMIDKKYDEFPDLRKMLLSSKDVYHLKEKFKDNYKALFDYIVDKFVLEFNSLCNQGVIKYKLKENYVSSIPHTDISHDFDGQVIDYRSVLIEKIKKNCK